MKLLDSSKYTAMDIDEQQNSRFEAFLDRNFPGWREREMFKSSDKLKIHRKWRTGYDGIERNAFYRKQYVEIHDEFLDDDDTENIESQTLKHRICDIDGDLTPVAVWGKRSQ